MALFVLLFGGMSTQLLLKNLLAPTAENSSVCVRRSEFPTYSEAADEGLLGAFEDRSMSPGHYLILLRLHEKKVKRRWCRHRFGPGA